MPIRGLERELAESVFPLLMRVLKASIIVFIHSKIDWIIRIFIKILRNLTGASGKCDR